MGNLVGGPLDSWVQDQIEVRQKTIANNKKIKEIISELGERVLHNNNRNSWVRMASSVDVNINGLNSEAIQRIGASLGSNFSKDFVLFGGVNFNPSTTKGGVVREQSEQNFASLASQYSYGLGEPNRGYQPIFGLDSVKIRHLNRGAIRKFDIKLKAFNKLQFEIIESLYLRLGYYMLLEWGHTVYIDQNKELVTSPVYNTPAFNSFYEAGKVDNDVVRDIKTQRQKTGGNYDGALFKVDNYSWSIDNDGTYQISISGVSKGGLIDSLTLSSPAGSGETIKDYIILNPSKIKKEQILKTFDVSFEDRKLDITYSETVGDKLAEGKFSKLEELGAIEFPSEYDEQEALKVSFTNEQDNDNTLTILDQEKSSLNKKLFTYHKRLKTTNWKQINGKNRYKSLDDNKLITLKFDNPNKPEDGYAYNYVTLGKLLDDIKSIFNQPDNIKINIDSEVETNLMFTHWFQHSVDPKVCLIPFTYTNDGSSSNLLSNILGNSFRRTGEEKAEFQGKVMSIHVNIEIIAKCLQDSIQQDTGEIGLYDFLDSLIYKIQGALGGINNFSITYTEEKDIPALSIYDDTIIPGTTDKDTDDYSLKLFGVQPNIEGSFVRNISTQSKISSQMATQIAIGSTASGVNKSTSMLSRWNEGLEDRLEKNKKKENNNPIEDPNKLLQDIEKKYEKYKEFIKNTYIDFKNPSPSVISSAQSNLKYILDYDLGVKTVNGEIAGKGFIPIDLSLELDGISGILLYQRIKTSDEILPTSYTEKVNFIVQAMDHTIQNNTWTTTLSTLSVPKKRDLSQSSSTSGFSIPKPTT
jgi:hypothetical protein